MTDPHPSAGPSWDDLGDTTWADLDELEASFDSIDELEASAATIDELENGGGE